MSNAGQALSSPELNSALRAQAFEEIVQSATLVISYSHSLAEAAFRGDQLTVEVHLKQILSVRHVYDPDVQGFLAGLRERYAREPVRLSDEARAWFFRGPRRGQG